MKKIDPGPPVTDLTASPDLLSPRERQVACKLALGWSTAEVARELAISQKTVDTHRAHVLEKLALRLNADLARWAVAHGLVVVPDLTMKVAPPSEVAA